MRTLAILASLVLAVAAHADAPATDVSIRQLIVLTRFDREINYRLTSIRMVRKLGAANEAAKALAKYGFAWEDPEARALRDELDGKVEALFNAEMSSDTITAEMVRIYARTYTEEEVKAQIAFYSSPVGRKVVETGQNLASQVTDISRDRMASLEAKVNVLVDETLVRARDLKAKRAPAKK